MANTNESRWMALLSTADKAVQSEDLVESAPLLLLAARLTPRVGEHLPDSHDVSLSVYRREGRTFSIQPVPPAATDGGAR